MEKSIGARTRVCVDVKWSFDNALCCSSAEQRWRRFVVQWSKGATLARFYGVVGCGFVGLHRQHSGTVNATVLLQLEDVQLYTYPNRELVLVTVSLIMELLHGLPPTSLVSSYRFQEIAPLFK